MQPTKAGEAGLLSLSVVNAISNTTGQRVRDGAVNGLFSHHTAGVYCLCIFLEFLAILWSAV